MEDGQLFQIDTKGDERSASRFFVRNLALTDIRFVIHQSGVLFLPDSQRLN